jgi:hypothetical protein
VVWFSSSPPLSTGPYDGSGCSRPREYGLSRDILQPYILGKRDVESAMHPILLFNPSLTLKIVIAVVTVAALVLFIRSYWKSGKL